MTAEQQRIHEKFEATELPRGWTCEKAWPWRDGTHLIAPHRRGGVVIKNRCVHVQLPGSPPSSPRVDIGEFRGRGWLDRMVEAAVKATYKYAPNFWGKVSS